MPANRIRPPRGLLIAAALLVLFALVAGPIGQALVPPEQQAKAILVLALPFISIFVAILLVFIYGIFVLAARFNGIIPPKVYQPIEAVIIAGIVLGVIGMFQGVTIFGYQFGFLLLLFSTLAFTAWSHVVPKTQRTDEVSPSELDHAAK